MIIDTNASLGNWAFRQLHYNDPEGLLERLGRVGIDRAWVTSFDAVLHKDCHDTNAPLAEQVAECDALMPVATINPKFPAWERDLAECVGKLGYRGARVYPNYQQFTLDDPVFAELLAAAEDLGIFISVAVRMADERHHHALCMVPPVDLTPLAKVAAERPNAPILVVNANNGDITPLVDAAQNLPRLYFELSHIESVGGVETLGRRIGLQHIVFGTHAPYYYPESAILKVTRECEFSEEELEGILHANAEGLLL